MSLFKRKKQIPELVPDSYAPGFRDWLLEDISGTCRWVAEYVRSDGSIDVSLAFHDMQDRRKHIFEYNIQSFAHLVAGFYYQYLGGSLQLMQPDVARVLDILNNLPPGVIIRSVQPKELGSKWAVQYLYGTVYYGKTLGKALDRLLLRNKTVADKLESNISKEEEKSK